MYFLPTESSETMHLKTVEEMRDLDFDAFEVIAVEILSKELDLKPSIFKRSCFTIHYKTAENEYKSYKYCRHVDEEPRKGCFGLCSKKPQTKTIVDSKTYLAMHNFTRHFDDIRKFLMQKEHLCSEGIFLKVGSLPRQNILYEHIKMTKRIDFDKLEISAYDCANVLKQYLKQMPDPLFLPKFFPAYERIARIAHSCDEDEAVRRKLLARIPSGYMLPPDSELIIKEQKLLDCLQLITHLLPQRRRDIFENTLNILDAVYAHRAYNRLSSEALGSVFAPLILCPRHLPAEVMHEVSKNFSCLVNRMIRNAKDIMGAPTKLRKTVWEIMRDPPEHLKGRRKSMAIL